MKKQRKKVLPKAPKTTTALTLTPEYRESLKFEKWVENFFNKQNPETYGNATKSALKVYNTEKINSAATIGKENYRKLQNMRSTIADMEGFGVGEFIKIAIAKAMKGEYKDWESLGIQLGHFDAEPNKIPQTGPTLNFNFGTIFEAMEASRKERGLPPLNPATVRGENVLNTP